MRPYAMLCYARRRPRPVLPGGVQMQVCVARGIVPGVESQRVVDWLRAGVESGQLGDDEHYRYYIDAAQRKFGPPPPRPVEMPETLDVDATL